MKISDLKKGDMFKFGKQSWDEAHRFHSIEKKGKQYYIFFISLNYLGDVQVSKWNSYTWSDDDIEVFIPKYLLSEQRRTKGKPCIPVSNNRIVLGINIGMMLLSNNIIMNIRM